MMMSGRPICLRTCLQAMQQDSASATTRGHLFRELDPPSCTTSCAAVLMVHTSAEPCRSTFWPHFPRPSGPPPLDLPPIVSTTSPFPRRFRCPAREGGRLGRGTHAESLSKWRSFLSSTIRSLGSSPCDAHLHNQPGGITPLPLSFLVITADTWTAEQLSHSTIPGPHTQQAHTPSSWVRLR